MSEKTEAARKAGRRVSVSGILRFSGVSRSGYQAWLHHVHSDTEKRRETVKEKIQDIKEYKKATENMQRSYSKKAFPWDNACIESFHSIIKREWLNRFHANTLVAVKLGDRERYVLFD